ncbi:MAG: hypothetical protein GXY74_13380 [Phycisphaerae bacterium]|nr:hypothetical protein [Phycisphaerae bacterium]
MMHASTRLAVMLLVGVSLGATCEARAENDVASAATAAELKTLLDKADVAAIRLTADITLTEPLAICRDVRIDGLRQPEPNVALIGDLVVASRRVCLANLRLDGAVSFQNAVRANLENVVANRVSRGPITFHFDNYYPVGFFANGDYWVRGPLTVTRMTPDFDGQKNGWEVNPKVAGKQGYRDHPRAPFDRALVPDLPYQAQGTLSIVKTVAAESNRPVIKAAVVLTVVGEIPPEHGAAVFRPPYVGDDKPYYFVRDLHTELLPALDPVDRMPTLESVEQAFSNLRMDYKPGLLGRMLRPSDYMHDYQAENTPVQNNGVLRMMIKGPLEEKMPALIQLVQFGLDNIHYIYLGQTWPAGGGHQPGHRLLPAFAAVLLDIQKAKDVLREARFFHGALMFYVGQNTHGLVLWGDGRGEEEYWSYLVTKKGNRSQADPYGYVDAGRISDGAYQVITSQAHKGELLATHLMPALKDAWNPEEWANVQNYTDRWVHFGQWALPDPCAPPDDNAANLGKTFGPDPANPGRAIAGSGRFPMSHGAHRDQGQFRSAFVAAMWDAYRASAAGAEKTPPYAAIIAPPAGAKVSGLVTIEASAFAIHGLASVQFQVNGQDYGPPVAAEPYRVTWDAAKAAAGDYTWTAVATDRRGNVFRCAPVVLQTSASATTEAK